MRAAFSPFLAVLAMLVAMRVAGAAETPAGERLPVPNSVAQTKVVNAIRAQYKPEYARRTAADQLALAQDFRQQATLAGEDPVKQYVLLREARELATNSGNFDAVFAIIGDTAKLFVVDAGELRMSALANAMDRSLIPKSELLENYLKVVDETLAHGDVNLAYQAMVLVKSIARGTRDPAVSQHIKPYALRVHDARREVTAVIAAANKLKANPNDPDASLLVGRYVSFVQGQWDAGLPLLARGSDKTLAGLAARDLAAPVAANDMADLADAWWDLPDTPQTPRRSSHQRAAHWYEQASSGLTAARKTKSDQRLAEAKASLPKQ